MSTQASHTERPVNRADLLEFVRSHGCPCRLTPHNTVRVAFQQSGGRGFSWRVVEIAPTLRSARAFLGY